MIELQIMLNDVADIMESEGRQTTPQGSNPGSEVSSPRGPRPAKTAAWSVPLSPESSSDNASDNSDLFHWSSELKLALNNVKNQQVNSAGASVASRKRKIWEQFDSLEVKTAPGQDGPHTSSEHEQLVDAPQQTSETGDALEKTSTRSRSKEKTKKDPGPSANRMSNWQVEDIDDNLAADLDGSLSGLGVDLSTASYNMSEALLALPSLTVFKQEAPSPSSQNDNGLQHSPTSGQGENDNPNNSPPSHSLHHLLQQHAAYGLGGGNQMAGDSGSQSVSGLSHSNSESSGLDRYHRFEKLNETEMNEDSRFMGNPVSLSFSSCRFQYVLAAATSIATKVNEETLTYLNQGQSYEIKLKKLGDLSGYRGKILKSVIRICFHERRLQYMEKEQIAAWQQSRPGDKIVEVDIPLSYGVYDVVQDVHQLNAVEFLWDPTKEVGVYIKVNCISTEFTPKKHGGEKGVPFRIQVETYSHGEGPIKRLHAAACQIKVFKLKGADRKHKQDREKILKRPIAEQEKYQPSYDCTVLTDIPIDAIYSGPMTSPVSSNVAGVNGTYSPQETHRGGGTPTSMTKEESPTAPEQDSTEVPFYLQPLPSEATAQQTAQWLQTHRFGNYLRTFNSFSGADILRLTRDDFIQICGLPDGIRLYNALHSKAIAPRLTLYICMMDQAHVFHALYLENLSCAEIVVKLAQLVGITPEQILDVYIQGPNGIHVLITDAVVRNIKDEAMFALEVIQDHSCERYRLLLKSAHR